MTTLRSSGESGALFGLSGEVATNATWEEDIYFTQDGAPLDISLMDWKMTFRCDPENTGADITLSITAGTLSVQADPDGNLRVLRISVPSGQLMTYEGDYIADLASKDIVGKVTLWAHGTVSFRLNPVTF